MKVTLEAVARAIDGTVVGDGSVEITGVAGIREAREGELTFLANPRYEPYLELTQASAVIVSENHRNTTIRTWPISRRSDSSPASGSGRAPASIPAR